MQGTKVFDPARVRDSMGKSRAANGGKQTVYGFEMKKLKPGKKPGKCEYFNSFFMDGTNRSPAIVRMGDETEYTKLFATKQAAKQDDKAEDYDKATYITISEGCRDPTQDPDSDQNDFRPSICANVEDAGEFGLLVQDMDTEFTTIMRTWRTPKDQGGLGIILNPDCAVRELVQKKYGLKTQATDKDGNSKRGQPLAKPKLRLNLDFTVNPMDHPIPAKRGKANTEIYDFRTIFIGTDGKVGYKPAMVPTGATGPDGKPVMELVGENNVHKFLRRGSRIIGGRAHFDYGTVSEMGASSSKLAARLIIDNKFAPQDGADDNPSTIQDVSVIASLAKIGLAQQSTPSTPAAPAPAVQEHTLGQPPVVAQPPAPTAVAPAAAPASLADVDLVLDGFPAK